VQKLHSRGSRRSSSSSSSSESGDDSRRKKLGNDSSRDTGLSGFSTGNPNKGGDTRVPTEEFGNSGRGDETRYNHGQQSTISGLEQKLAGHSTAPNNHQYGASTHGRADHEIDSTRAGSGGKHGISGLFNKETNKLHKEPPPGY